MKKLLISLGIASILSGVILVPNMAEAINLPYRTKATKKILCYLSAGGQQKGWIDPGDDVIIKRVSGKWAYVNYPVPRGRAERWIVLSEIYTEPSPYPSDSKFCYPVDNPGFQYRQWGAGDNNGRYHVALDFYSNDRAKGSAQTQTPIRAIADGILVNSGYNDANGNNVVIKHNINGREFYSFYAHMNSYNVYSYGLQIKKGQIIGYLGATGKSSNGIYHLHFSIADRVKYGSYYGYISNYVNGNTAWDSKGQVTFYNPRYVLDNGRLP